MRAKHFVVPQDFLHIDTRLSNARDFALFDSMDPGVIGRQGQGKIALVEIQQMPQLFGAAANILQRVVAVSEVSYIKPTTPLRDTASC